MSKKGRNTEVSTIELVSIALLSGEVTPLLVAPADAFARQVQLLRGVAPLAHERAGAAQQRLGAAQHLDEHIQPWLLTLAHQDNILPCVVVGGDSVEEDHRELVLLGVRAQSREALGRIASDDVAHGNVQAHPGGRGRRRCRDTVDTARRMRGWVGGCFSSSDERVTKEVLFYSKPSLDLRNPVYLGALAPVRGPSEDVYP